jgi:hypothetical protein
VCAHACAGANLPDATCSSVGATVRALRSSPLLDSASLMLQAYTAARRRLAASERIQQEQRVRLRPCCSHRHDGSDDEARESKLKRTSQHLLGQDKSDVPLKAARAPTTKLADPDSSTQPPKWKSNVRSVSSVSLQCRSHTQAGLAVGSTEDSAYAE